VEGRNKVKQVGEMLYTWYMRLAKANRPGCAYVSLGLKLLWVEFYSRVVLFPAVFDLFAQAAPFQGWRVLLAAALSLPFLYPFTGS